MITSVKYIIIVIVMITTGAIAVSKILMGNCTLQVLHVNDHTIGDDGILVIVEQLQHITTLTELDVMDCGLSVKGTIVCVKCIINPDSEDYLTISLAVRLFSLPSISGHTLSQFPCCDFNLNHVVYYLLIFHIW